MDSLGHLLSVVAVVIVIWTIIDLLRRKKLRERHAFWWLLLAVFGLIFTLVPGLLDWFSDMLGVGVPLNLAFFVAIVILFLINTQQSKELTLLEDRTRVLAEQVALIRQEQKNQSSKSN